MVVDEVVGVAGLVANLWLGDDLHGDVVLGVVEVDDVHVKDQHGRAWDVLAWREPPPPREHAALSQQPDIRAMVASVS